MCKEFILVIQLLIKLQDTSTSPITPERVSGLDRRVFQSHCVRTGFNAMIRSLGWTGDQQTHLPCLPNVVWLSSHTCRSTRAPTTQPSVQHSIYHPDGVSEGSQHLWWFVYYPGLSYEIIHHEVPRTRILSGQEGALMKASLEIFLRTFH